MDAVDLPFVLEHWPFMVVALLLGVTGEVVKRLVKHREALKPKVVWPSVYHATLPLHAPLIGALVGLLPGIPCPEAFCTDAPSKILYYVAAGMLSSYVYAAVKHLAKSRFGISDPTETSDTEEPS
jgi:hypothetical protein